jgi:hypothetical protein
MDWIKEEVTALPALGARTVGLAASPLGTGPFCIIVALITRYETSSLPCIYALEGDELRLCCPLLRKIGTERQQPIERPKSFETKGTKFAVLVAVRERR